MKAITDEKGGVGLTMKLLLDGCSNIYACDNMFMSSY